MIKGFERISRDKGVEGISREWEDTGPDTMQQMWTAISARKLRVEQVCCARAEPAVTLPRTRWC